MILIQSVNFISFDFKFILFIRVNCFILFCTLIEFSFLLIPELLYVVDVVDHLFPLFAMLSTTLSMLFRWKIQILFLS